MTRAKKQVQPVQEVQDIVHFEGVKKFQSNGVSQHMVKDAVFELNYEMAKLLVGKGYGQLID